YCDYCDTFLTHDSRSVRKTHCSGRHHRDAVRMYYQKWLEEQVQKLVDNTTARSSPALPGLAAARPCPCRRRRLPLPDSTRLRRRCRRRRCLRCARRPASRGDDPPPVSLGHHQQPPHHHPYGAGPPPASAVARRRLRLAWPVAASAALGDTGCRPCWGRPGASRPGTARWAAACRLTHALMAQIEKEFASLYFVQ
ncbi:hypothetical protein BOX15_Mlig006261g1, partial [Macrostomum lignano]